MQMISLSGYFGVVREGFVRQENVSRFASFRPHPRELLQGPYYIGGILVTVRLSTQQGQKEIVIGRKRTSRNSNDFNRRMA